MILTSFFSVLTLISSIICSCLVFYNEKARTDVNSNKVLATNNTYISTLVTYNQNNKLNLASLSPGYTLEQTFSITNNNSNTISYNLEWENVISTWNQSENSVTPHPEEFIYSIICTNGEKIENQTMPTDNKTNIILENLELKTNKTNACSIKISYLDKGTDQYYNNNKSFSGVYKVVVKE